MKKPIIEEIVQEMKAGLEQMRIKFVQQGLKDDDILIGETKTIEDRVYFHYFNHFPRKLPNNEGEFGWGSLGIPKYQYDLLSKCSGKSPEEFQKDIFTAIQESGVDKVAFGRYIDLTFQQGINPPATAEIYRELFVPVYLKLREMGYSKQELFA